MIKVDIVGNECRYECADLKSGMPLHSHIGGAEHFTRCDSGRIVVFVEPNEVHRLSPGEELHFDSTVPHGIYPLEAGSRFTNVCKVELAEYHGEMQMHHQAPEWAR